MKKSNYTKSGIFEDTKSLISETGVCTIAIADKQASGANTYNEFINNFNDLYSKVLIKKLRVLKAELKDQYEFEIKSSDVSKRPDILERPIFIKSKADKKLGKISIIKFLEKNEFSIQGIPLTSNPTQLYNKIAIAPFTGTLQEFDTEKFEGYILYLLNYCFE